MPEFRENLENIIPLEARLLAAHNFFELYPYDGGGFHIHQGMFGTLDDSQITARIIDQGALAAWGDLPALDFARFERWRSIEYSCWLTRCYFLVSMARHCFLTGDTNIAALVRDTLLHLVRHYPGPRGQAEIQNHLGHLEELKNRYNRRPFAENAADEGPVPYLWFDFQPASRILHIIYTLYFLKNSPTFSPAQRDEIHQSLYRHAELILIEENQFLPLQKSNNHQSLRGLALLYAGRFFDGYGACQAFLDTGRRICRFHAEQDFCPDGTLAENSPSYHGFETWHLRDAALLLRQAGDHGTAAELEKVLIKACRFLKALRQPDGQVPVINDGYSLALEAFGASLPGPAAAATASGGMLFADAGLAFHKSANHYLALDASVFPGPASHYHAGKNAPIYWYGGKPFLVDSGCCGYDDPLFAGWYKQACAHSTLLIDEAGDGQAAGTYRWTHHAQVVCTPWRPENAAEVMTATLTSTVDRWQGVRWTRELKIDDTCLLLTDTVTHAGGKTLGFLFNLHPAVTVEPQDQGFTLHHTGATLRFSVKESRGAQPVIALRTGRYFDGRGHRPNRQILLTLLPPGDCRVQTLWRSC